MTSSHTPSKQVVDYTQSANTNLLHHQYQPPTGFSAPQVATHKASTTFFSSVAAMRNHRWQAKDGYSYGLHGTPSSFILEERIASLEGGRFCTLYPSGLAAICNVNMALLRSGDTVLLPDNVYGPNLAFAQNELQNFGVKYALYNPMSATDLEKKITTSTRLVWLEAAGSVSMEFPPLLDLVRVCREKGIVCALDNTWGAGLAFSPFCLDFFDSQELGVDISVHALTKYPSGGGDVLMGSIVCRDEALHLKCKQTRMHLGWGVGGNDVEGVLRGLPSMTLRYEAQDSVAREVAAKLSTRDEITHVLHPAWGGAKSDATSHQNWKRHCTTVSQPQGWAAALFSVVFDPRYSQDQVDAFCERLRLFKLGYSWAGPVSLVVPYDMTSMRTLSKPEWQRRGSLVRFAIGLESASDLWADLEQALDVF
jgi:cystathionine beta-lyase